MRTVHCPLCGLRYAHVSELDCHAREDHAPPAAKERQETLLRRLPGRARARAVLHSPW